MTHQQKMEEFDKKLANKLAYIGSSGQKHLDQIRQFLAQTELEIYEEMRRWVKKNSLNLTDTEDGDCVYLSDLLSHIDQKIKEINTPSDQIGGGEKDYENNRN